MELNKQYGTLETFAEDFPEKSLAGISESLENIAAKVKEYFKQVWPKYSVDVQPIISPKTFSTGLRYYIGKISIKVFRYDSQVVYSANLMCIVFTENMERFLPTTAKFALGEMPNKLREKIEFERE